MPSEYSDQSINKTLTREHDFDMQTAIIKVNP